MILIFNASPLIVLAKADLLETILCLPEQVMVPQAVAEELLNCDNALDPACVWLQKPESLEFLQKTPPTADFVMAWGLGAGESSVISLAGSMPQSTAVLDDLAARRCATALGLNVIGTLGLVITAKKAGRIQNVAAALDAIVAAGLFISERHLTAIRKQAGE